MLSEEALILVAVLVACGLLLLGVMELLWPTRRRVVRLPPSPLLRRPSLRSELIARRVLEPARGPEREPAPAPMAVPIPVHLAGSLPVQLSLMDEIPVPVTAAAAEPIEVDVADPVPATTDERGWPTPAVEIVPAYASVLEECEDLCRQRRYTEVVAVGTGALLDDGEVREVEDPAESAALWSVVARAHRDLGEDTEARSAAEAAFAVAPADDRSRYEEQLVTMAATAARDLTAQAERLISAQADKRLVLVRDAVAWLESALAVKPGDEELEDHAGTVRAVLWSAYERAALALVHRQEFRGARRLLREAVAHPLFPVARTDVFRELFTGTFSGEIGQLTAKAIRSMHAARESDALAALQRAETLLDNLGDDVLSPSRREEVDGRLWWGYNRLGERRVAAGEYEIALDPLFHALEYDAGPARLEETRALLVRALEGMADVRALAIRELAAAGDRDAATLQCDALWTALRSATDSGLSRHELAGAFTRAQRLADSLTRTRD